MQVMKQMKSPKKQNFQTLMNNVPEVNVKKCIKSLCFSPETVLATDADKMVSINTCVFNFIHCVEHTKGNASFVIKN